MRYFIVFALLISLAACSNNDDLDPIDEVLSSEFFPLELGHTTTYQIEETIFNKRSQTKETLVYQLKEEITDSFIDDAGNTVFTIDRSMRPGATNGWTYQNSWQALISANQAIRIEENRRYIKLRLPVIKDDEWDGNALFDDSDPITISGDPIDYYKNWSSKLLSTNSTETVGGQSYTDVYSVSLADYENKLELRSGKEYYAQGIGLIYREINVLDTQCFDDCATQPWIDKAENGHIFIQTLIN